MLPPVAVAFRASWTRTCGSGSARRSVPVAALTLLLAVCQVVACSSPAKRFAPTGAMSSSRFQPSLVKLMSGLVLVVGGMNENNDPLAASELYDPRSEERR